MSSSSVPCRHDAGSDASGCDKTILNDFPAAMVYDITCLISPILESKSERIRTTVQRTYQQFKVGFSTNQAVSGSASILLAGTVALYAAKPTSLGGTPWPPNIRSRAADRMPISSSECATLKLKHCRTFGSNHQIRVMLRAIFQSHERRVEIVVYNFASRSHFNS